jgi:hypothetical protein
METSTHPITTPGPPPVGSPPEAPPAAGLEAPVPQSPPPGRDRPRRRRRRGYFLSLPERAARTLAAVVGGALYETSRVVLPEFVRQSRLYQATVARLLRLAVELVGGVEGVYEAEPIPAIDLLARKTAGNAVELASILAVGWSPLWLLAAAADVAGGSKVYLRALEAELKRLGLLPAVSDVSTVEDLLARVETTSGVLADAIDVPPFRPADLRSSWEALRRQVTDPLNAAGLAALAADLQRAVRREGRPVQELAGALGLGAARAGVRLGTAYVLDYYREALRDVAREGFDAYLRRATRPYLRRVAGHLDPAMPTHTERLLVRARRQLHRIRRLPAHLRARLLGRLRRLPPW